jgi:tocopherol cyclase
MYFIKKLFNPELFQGNNRKRNYFEGWYYKVIDEGRKNVYAIIPGIAIGKNPKDRHAFIQVSDAVKGEAEYFRFDYESFKFDKKILLFSIGDNLFTDRFIILDLKGEKFSIKGRLVFVNIVKYPKSLLNPGIMGPFSFIPFMECIHGIVNINHLITGKLNINDNIIDFEDGEGYIEKDRGKSFPDSWVWLQANHFDDTDITFMFSIADIPFMGFKFKGFISFLRYKNKFYNFSTYNSAKLKNLKINKKSVEGLLKKRNISLEFKANQSGTSMLKAPKNGQMDRMIEESISSVTSITFKDKINDIDINIESGHSGLEIVT